MSARQGRNIIRGAGALERAGWAGRISTTVCVTVAYVLAIAGAEVLGIAVDARVGAIGHATVLFVLLNHRLFARGLLGDVLVALALVPLLRLLSVTIGFGVAEVYQYGLVGARSDRRLCGPVCVAGHGCRCPLRSAACRSGSAPT